jgi:non-heme chloroperoxidase
MPRIEVDEGVELHVVDVGSGAPVVLLHGWGLSGQVWDRQVRRLLEAGRRAVCIDLRGHGRSDAPAAGYGVERLAADVVTVLERLGLRDVDLVGWSLGGVTSFRVALDRPDLLRRLVLVGSNGVATTRHDGFPFGAPADAIEPGLVAAELDDRLTFRRKVIAEAFHEPPETALLEWLIAITMQTPSWVGGQCLSTLLRTDQSGAAADVRVPVRQIVGESDPVLSRKGAAWLRDHLPDFEQVVLPGCGHYPMLEAPAALDDALLGAVAV